MAWFKGQMDNELHRELKARSAKFGITLEQAIVQAVEWWVYGVNAAPRKERPRK